MLTEMNLQQSVSKNVSTKLHQQEYGKINKLVADGLFLNSADFVREAIRGKLKAYGEVSILREISYVQMKQEIIEYVKNILELMQ